MGDFPLFIFAVLKQWTSYMSGPVSIVLYLWARNKGKEIPAKWYIRIAVLFAFVGCFMAWEDQYHAAQSAIAQIDQNSPKLAGEIQLYIAGVVPELQTAIMLLVRVSNVGSPSIVRDWALTVVLPSGKEIRARNIFIPITITMPTPKGLRVFRQEDALYNKTTTPIPNGGEQTGILLFEIPDLPPKSSTTLPDELRESGAKVVLEFHDIKNKRYTCSKVVSGTPDSDIFYYPGTKPPL